MQIDFQEERIRCLEERVTEILYQEETAEVIVPDVYPDAAAVAEVSVICCVRDQEVRQGAINVSGTFQATVLFTAEESGEVCVQDVWLPFAVRLSDEQIPADGVGRAEVRVRMADARILNSRKLLVRISYGARLSVFAPSTLCSRSCEQRGGVQLLRTQVSHYTVLCAAEKTMDFSDTLQLPAMESPVSRVARVRPTLRMREQKLKEGRAVCHGVLDLSILCLLETGQLSRCNLQLPVSQYLDLEGEPEEGTLRVLSSLTEFRLEEDASGAYLLTVGVRLQVMVWGTVSVSLFEDGYCIGKTFTAVQEPIELRRCLGEPQTVSTAEIQLRGEASRPLDAAVWVDFPVCRRTTDDIAAGAVATATALYYDAAGVLRGETGKTEISCKFPVDSAAVCYADAECDGETLFRGNGPISHDVQFRVSCMELRQKQMIVSAETGSDEVLRENMPSLTVRRLQKGERLWDAAKRNGTTVRAVCLANGLESEEAPEGMLLLIPAYSEDA